MSGWWGYDGPSRPAKPVKGGIRAKSQRGAIGQAWWSKQWIIALERLVDKARLGRGRSYARKGQVVDIKIGAKGVTAKVQGSRATPYTVKIVLAPLDDRVWASVLDALAAEARFSAQLLAGEMPTDVEDAFVSAGTHLFPHAAADLTTDCSCPDWSNPCKHVAAVHYLLGEALDDDPFLLFQLRGRERAAVLAGLAERRAGVAGTAGAMGEAATAATIAAAPESMSQHAPTARAKASRKSKGAVLGDGDVVVASASAPVLDITAVDADAFWRLGAPLDGIVTAPAPVDGVPALLRRLGQPSFTTDDVLLALGSAYAAVAARAVGVASGAGGDEAGAGGRPKGGGSTKGGTTKRALGRGRRPT